MRRVHGERGEHRKDLVKKHIRQKLLIAVRQFVLFEDKDSRLAHLILEVGERVLLTRHQAARLFVDQHELFGRA